MNEKDKIAKAKNPTKSCIIVLVNVEPPYSISILFELVACSISNAGKLIIPPEHNFGASILFHLVSTPD